MHFGVGRRHWLGLGVGTAAATLGRRMFAGIGGDDAPAGSSAPPRAGRPATGAPRDTATVAREAGFELLDLTLGGAGDLARRAFVLVPRDAAKGARLPLLILLHGLGETTSEDAGVRAWVDRYGLVSCHARLAHPPVTPVTNRGDLTADRARAINTELAAHPYDGQIVLACPFTPNVWRTPNPRRALDRYADWIADALLPELRAKTPAHPSPARTGFDGCSLGGFVGLEVFLRKPELFGAWGGVQSAFAEAAAPAFATRLAAALERAGPRRLHIETSTGDPFFKANVALARELERRGISHDRAVLPGPHDQPFLREAGTLEMLLWHHRALEGSP
jgi:predicted esterase